MARVAGGLTVLLGVLVAFLCASTGTAAAHPLSTTEVLLDIGSSSVRATIDLPLDELGVARDHWFTADDVTEPATLPGLRTYVQQHLSVTDARSRSWTTVVSGGTVAQLDGQDNLVLTATLTPATGPVGAFVLHYDAIMDTVLAHRVFVSGRFGSTGPYTTVAMLSWQQTSVRISAASSPAAGTAPTSEEHGFLTAVRLGVAHISSGSDHLLFLIMLLLPAPLAVAGRGSLRWVRRDDVGRSAGRVVHVVTAFAVGHSVTLALGALGWVHLSTRLVESGIALSVLVSAIHAVRPLVRLGEVAIAGSFGLLHGLSFAALLTQLHLGRADLVTTLLGFNLGIELSQLLVVALVMPSLIVLSRSKAYQQVRVILASLGAALAAGWLAERSGLIARNPLDPVGELLVQHPMPLAAGLALLALGSRHATKSRVVSLTPENPETGGAVGDRNQSPSPLMSELVHDSLLLPQARGPKTAQVLGHASRPSKGSSWKASD